MTPKEYLKIKDPDTALAVRLAVTMGWKPSRVQYIRSCFGNYVDVSQKIGDCVRYYTFSPFTDERIPYGLIGQGLISVRRYEGGWIATEHLWYDAGQIYLMHEDKTTAILMGYCQADPMGHWAKFIGEKE